MFPNKNNLKDFLPFMWYLWWTHKANTFLSLLTKTDSFSCLLVFAKKQGSWQNVFFIIIISFYFWVWLQNVTFLISFWKEIVIVYLMWDQIDCIGSHWKAIWLFYFFFNFCSSEKPLNKKTKWKNIACGMQSCDLKWEFGAKTTCIN